MTTRARTGLRSPDASLARRIEFMQAALRRASADSSALRQTNDDLRRELARLQAENRRLQTALDQSRSADPQLRPLPEMTAGTCIGPRRPARAAAGRIAGG